MQGRGSAHPFISSFCFFLLLFICRTPVLAVDHSVSWTLGVTYDNSGQTFYAGDTITFTWSGTHDVVLVSASDYSACTSSTGDQRYASSPAVVSLMEAGTSYYMICSVSGHCSNGMKYMATTLSATSNSSSPTPSPSSSPPPPPPSSSSSSNSTSPPPPSSSSSSSSSSSPPPPSGNYAAALSFTPYLTAFSAAFLVSFPFLRFA